MRSFFTNSSSWTARISLIIALTTIGWICRPSCAKDDPASSKTAVRKNAGGTESENGSISRVTVSHPKSGGIPRISEQPGTMESFDFADLYAKISGYVLKQTVDIGSKVKVGDVLMEIDAPEFEEALNEASAALAQAEAQVAQMQARVATAKAEFEAAETNISLADAELLKASSYLKFREIQYDRVKKLFDLKSIDERLVDEKYEQRDAAHAAENSGRAAVAAAKAQTIAAKARIDSADADVLEAKAQVRLAKAKEARARVFVGYTKITSPYDGVVTRRSFHVGDFVRAADQGGAAPLLTVARTDLMRVIVQIPERDVPFTNVDDAATVAPISLDGEKFSGTVARISHSEDLSTRTMRAEIDLPNPNGRYRNGMFCRVAITLSNSVKNVQISSSSVVIDSQTKKRSVFVVSDGRVERRAIDVGQDDGKSVEVVSGLTTKDLVIDRPARDLTEGARVEYERAAPR